MKVRRSDDLAIVVQTVCDEREIAVYSHAAPDHPEGQRTTTVM